MELAVAIIGLLGSVVGGAGNYLGIGRQASAIEYQSDVARDIQLGGFNAWVEGMLARERALIAGLHYQRDIDWIQGDIQRDRIFYNYMAANALRSSLVTVAGAALLAMVAYLVAKED